jgi:hypothetical protein
MNDAVVKPCPSVINKADEYQMMSLQFDGEIVKKTMFNRNEHGLNFMKVFLPQLIAKPEWSLVQVYSFEPIHSPHAKYPFGYQYHMERLLPLSEEERAAVYVYAQIDDIFHSDEGLYPDEQNDERRFTKQEEDAVMQRMNIYYPQLGEMMAAVGEFYHDMHEDNVMKTANEVYKMIDLESLILMDADGKPMIPHFPPHNGG